MTALFFSFLAGVFTTLNPCVLPMVPIVLASSLEASRHGPLALSAGLVVSFTAIGMLVAVAGFSLGIDAYMIRIGAAWFMIAAGVVLFSATLQGKLAMVLQPVSGRAGMAIDAGGDVNFGLKGQFVTGLLLGLVWSPCSGPSLGAAISLAAEGGSVFAAGTRMLAYGIGAGGVMALLAYGSRAAISGRKEVFMQLSRYAKPVMGIVFVALGIAILTGFDKTVEGGLVRMMPDWLGYITTVF